MAPMAVEEGHTLKRSLADAGFGASKQGKRQTPSLHHHYVHWRQDKSGTRLDARQDNGAIQSLLARSISLALEAVGFEQSDPVALESFRAGAEEYMAHFLATVRQSMLSSRRIQATPQDFLYALDVHQLTLRSLIPHLDPPVPPAKSQILQEVDSSDTTVRYDHDRSIAKLLNSSTKGGSTAYIPPHFPTLPSRHTYIFEDVYTKRETDPRKVRERATEEGRLGEEALRKLVSVRADGSSSMGLQSGSRRTTTREKSKQLWLETMEAVMRDDDGDLNAEKNLPESNGMEMDVLVPDQTPKLGFLQSSVVNADRIYWRKGTAADPTRSKPQTKRIIG